MCCDCLVWFSWPFLQTKGVFIVFFSRSKCLKITSFCKLKRWMKSLSWSKDDDHWISSKTINKSNQTPLRGRLCYKFYLFYHSGWRYFRLGESCTINALRNYWWRSCYMLSNPISNWYDNHVFILWPLRTSSTQKIVPSLILYLLEIPTKFIYLGKVLEEIKFQIYWVNSVLQ